MSDIKLDAAGDLDVTDFVAPRMFTAGEAISAVGQRVTTRLRTFLGEWFADTSTGVPWYQQIIGARNAEALATAIVRDVIQSTPGVFSVDMLSVVLDPDRVLVIAFTATTSEGPLSLSVALSPANPPPLLPTFIDLSATGTFVTVDVSVGGDMWRVVGVEDGDTATLSAVLGTDDATAAVSGVDVVLVGRGGSGGAASIGPGGGGGGGGGIVATTNRPIVTGSAIGITPLFNSTATIDAVTVAEAGYGGTGGIGGFPATGDPGGTSLFADLWAASPGTTRSGSNGGGSADAASSVSASVGVDGGGGGGASSTPSGGGGGGGPGGVFGADGADSVAGAGGDGGGGITLSTVCSASIIAGIAALSTSFGGVWTDLASGVIAGGGGGGGATAGVGGLGGGGDGGQTSSDVAVSGSRPGAGGGGAGTLADPTAVGGPSIAVIAWRI